ncbi:aldehyde dehydrogenase [Steroidobacter denitrificans]|uniref:Aldehyde dehydrogenase n=1 Tax=Steroidobacter denitrificans TaxID=465721 RepID=A0A127F987_STEDE|nr:aldehyde dehydrogenase family protein [Steroidobacter denitrificans]AMN46201.1 aldehyde dehydrogenase [Steroidobacter denitrificans]
MLPDLAPETRLFIDGRLVESSTGARFENLNPATGQVLGTTADGTAADMRAAVAAARRAFDETGWASDPALRARCLRQLHAGLLAEKEQLRAIVVREAGAPISLTTFMHVDGPIDMLSWWAEKAERYVYERAMPEGSFLGQRVRRLLRREAMGVVGAITPWNVPLLLNLTKIGHALAAGCTVVLKPAPDTPWSATHLGRIASEHTELPAGVLNIVASADSLVGEALVRDPRVDMVSFTGSTATGRRVMECSAGNLKKVFLELGGKSAAIVLDDADLASVLPGAAATCIHAGQGCALTTRWLVPRSRYAESIEILRTAFQAWKYGDPEDPVNLQGPQISRRQQERVLGYIERGRAEGARLLVGGGRPTRRGFFVEPTLFVDVDPRATIAQEEIFGPVCCVIPYDGDEQAVRIANDSVYGLSGAVYSPDEARALQVARRIRTGTISVNGGQWFQVDAPFGGYRQSGIGRENGEQGFEEHLETKVIALPGTPPG